MRRSLKASGKGIDNAKKEFKKKGWTQQILADLAGCSRPVVSNFFHGRQIDKQKFIDICEILDLKWTEIAGLEAEDETKLENEEISQLVLEIRALVKESVESECGTMRVLDMTRPIELSDIYTQVNILEKIIGRRRFNLDQLLRDFNLEEFDRFGLGRIQHQRVPGLYAAKNYSKLMILGKPGVGKTTFLKYLAMQCIRGKFAGNKIPVFIPLKKFAETSHQPNLKAYITQWFNDCKITNAAEKVEIILEAGRVLVLLDGLDEVREKDSQRVIREIEDFYTSFSANQFAITCRIAAREYTFTQFTEVEVADFDQEQIENFVTSWFQIKQLVDYAKYFMEQLKANPTIKELANNPLLLTLLCLEFEDSGNFPTDRADLYTRATNTLLRKWDDKRHIYRQPVYKELTVKRKEGLLSQIAYYTFANNEYFFKQRTLERYIGEYIGNLPNAPQDQTSLDIDSQAVLKSIEAQHGLLIERARGIYSFSHLTFQEYFTARKIATTSNPDAMKAVLSKLANNITEKHWGEVFLLTAGMLEPADLLLQLMKQKIDNLIADDQKIQKSLSCATEKAISVNASYKNVAIRAFYLDLLLALDFNFDFSRSLDFSLDLALDLDLSQALKLSLDLTCDSNLSLDQDQDPILDPDLSLDLDLFRSYVFYPTQNLYQELSKALEKCQDSQLKKVLLKLQKQLPKDEKKLKQWWQEKGLTWAEELNQAMIKYRNIGHKWEFNRKQLKLIDQYLTANKLLVDCLNSECYVSREVREEIKNTLLLPISALRSNE